MAKILIIDDEPLIRNTLRWGFEKAEYEVIEACNGEEGIEQYNKNLPDLVIADIFMPVKEGLSTIIELRKNYPDAKIIVMTGGINVDYSNHQKSGILSTAMQIGAIRTFSKPFDISDMVNAVNKILKEKEK